MYVASVSVQSLKEFDSVTLEHCQDVSVHKQFLKLLSAFL